MRINWMPLLTSLGRVEQVVTSSENEKKMEFSTWRGTTISQEAEERKKKYNIFQISSTVLLIAAFAVRGGKLFLFMQ